ncbi:NADP-dependent oxidoreductase domain-containing protein [Mycena sp. CBHHK59/15]|nr:NADP-dependent oxidoreductase domain-containing protein [Mycena sp. CBHHK59/15]
MSSTCTLGNSTFSSTGFGAMGLSTAYGMPDSDEEHFKFKRTGKHDSISLMTKFGFKLDLTISGSLEYVESAIELSLKRLCMDCVPIKHTLGAMAKLINTSDISASTLHCAHTVHPIASIQVRAIPLTFFLSRHYIILSQVEYSPFMLVLDIEDLQINLLVMCHKFVVKVITYAPLGCGLLTGQIIHQDFDNLDLQKHVEKFNAKNFPNIIKLTDRLKAIRVQHSGVTACQVALAWLLMQRKDVILILGMPKVKYLLENFAASALWLSAADMTIVQEVVKKI